jgi:hypothetical protein
MRHEPFARAVCPSFRQATSLVKKRNDSAALSQQQRDDARDYPTPWSIGYSKTAHFGIPSFENG